MLTPEDAGLLAGDSLVPRAICKVVGRVVGWDDHDLVTVACRGGKATELRYECRSYGNPPKP